MNRNEQTYRRYIELKNGAEPENDFDIDIKKFILNHPRYFNCHLSAFIYFNCRQDMTVGDIDTVTWDYVKKIIRFIDQKRSKESIENDSQDRLYKLLLSAKIENHTIECYKIIGDYPYDYSKIYSYELNKTVKANFNELKDFIDFKIDFDSLEIIYEYKPPEIIDDKEFWE